MDSPLQSTLAAFHRSFISVSNWKKAQERGFKRFVAVMRFIIGNGYAARVGGTRRCGRADGPNGTLQHQMENHSLAYDKGCVLFAIFTASIVEEMNFHAYAYIFYKMEEVLSTPADLYYTGMYAWESQTMTRV